MWEDIAMLAVGNGLWAVLSCALLSYLLKDSKKRECKYTEIIERLTERLEVVLEIRESVEDLSDKIEQSAGDGLQAAPQLKAAPQKPRKKRNTGAGP